MKVTILGCGSSCGVPRLGNDWGDCDPKNPKNRRRRCSILLRQDDATVLIDTAPDMREQLLDARVDALDGVVWTHDHADQTHGLDDLRVLAARRMRRVDVWGDANTLGRLKRRFGYCFSEGAEGEYPAILKDHLIEGVFSVGPFEFRPFEQDHGGTVSLGFRIGDLAYANDVVALDDKAFAAMAGAKTMIVDALRYTPHPTHAHLALSLEWIARVRPERAVLTNLHIDMDYETLRQSLPAGVEPAFDGMEMDI